MYQQNTYNQGMNTHYQNNQPQYYGHQQPQQYGGPQEPPPNDYSGFSVGQQPHQDVRVETVVSHQTEPIKEIERSAMFTFCPCGPYMAAGSVAGAIDLSFSTSSQLEVCAFCCNRTGGMDLYDDDNGSVFCRFSLWTMGCQGNN